MAMNEGHEPLTREQLYELVWREPMLKVAARFGVSSSYMARVCTELRVPRPERGHWAKLEHGKESAQPVLPAGRPGDCTHWSPGTSVGTAQRTLVRQHKAPARVASIGPAPLEKRHELLVGVKPHFLKTRESDTGLLRPFKRLLVDLVASEKHLDATLEAADALFKALTVRGHRVTLAPPNEHMHREDVDEREVPQGSHYHRKVWSPDKATVAYVGGVAIGLTLFEMTEEAEVMYVGNNKYVPVRDLTPEQLRRYQRPHYWRTKRDIASGRLALQAYSTSWRVKWLQRWQEAKAGQFASIVGKAVKELEAVAPELARKKAAADRHAEEEHRKREEQWRRVQEAAELARQAKARQDARQDLLAAIASWEQARSIHAYFEAVERELEQVDVAEREQLRIRLSDARKLVGEVDGLAHLKRWKAPHER
jgi:hypothetical protein